MKALTLLLAIAIAITPACSSKMPGVKAQKTQQQELATKFGRNFHGPNKFKKRHFKRN